MLHTVRGAPPLRFRYAMMRVYDVMRQSAIMILLICWRLRHADAALCRVTIETQRAARCQRQHAEFSPFLRAQ